MAVGVIGHVMNPSVDDAVAMAQAAEEAGADWMGFADAFWWRDVWMLLARVAESTHRLEIGPAMTNPYLRHRFHTVAALATLQDLAGPRVFAGIAAGGSEVSVAAHVSRSDAPDRVAELIDTIREAALGRPLDASSGRYLDLSLAPVPVLVAGRGDRMLRVGAALADRVLLWSVPDSDLERSGRVVARAACARDDRPELVWAPLVAHDAGTRAAIRDVAVYASINTAPEVRAGWGLDAEQVATIRAALVAGGTEAAIDLVPRAALDDLVIDDPEPHGVAARGRAIGATSVAVPCYDPRTVGDHVAWARSVERLLVSPPPGARARRARGRAGRGGRRPPRPAPG